MGKYDFDKIIDRRGTACIKYDGRRRMGRDDLLPMWVADMDFELPSEITDVLHARVDHGIFGYTDPDDAYFETLDKWFRKRYKTPIKKEWLVITPGIVYAIGIAIRAVTEKGESVLIQEPVYYPFREIVEDNDRVCVSNDLVYRNGRYEIDFEDLEEKLKRPELKLMVISSPHNPVGKVFTRAELEKISRLCLENKVVLFADEIHCDFIFKGREFTPFLSLGRENTGNVIVATSPAKSFNIPGFQISNILIPDNGLRLKFRRQNSAAGYSQPNLMGLTACKAAYDFGGEWLDELKDYLEGNLCFLRDYLRDNIPDVKLVEPDGTYLLWLDFSQVTNDRTELRDLIVEKARLWLDAGRIFGGNSDLFERINIAVPRVVLKEALERLKVAIQQREALAAERLPNNPK